MALNFAEIKVLYEKFQTKSTVFIDENFNEFKKVSSNAVKAYEVPDRQAVCLHKLYYQ